MTKTIFSTAMALILVSALAAQAQTIREAAGADPAAIQPTVDSFRVDLGTLNANEPGSEGTGRREINWDGVPVTDDTTLAAPGVFPGTFFNAAAVGRARGVVFSTAGDLFQVSAATTDPLVVGLLTLPEFGNINATYPTQFIPFSAQRLFTPLATNSTDITFFEPGTDIPALTRGFGAVFTDVDQVDAARIEYYDVEDNLLLSRSVLPANEGLSFLGVSYSDPIIARVRVVNGTAAPGPDDLSTDPAGPDIVVTDDFIFGEPVVFPTISIDDVTVTEGNSGQVPAEFTVTLSAATTREVRVAFATLEALANTATNDFVSAVGVLTFAPGETTQTVTVNVVGDTQFEPNETFHVILTNPEAARIADDQGTGTILDDDAAPNFLVNDPQVTEGDEGTKVRFTVSLSNATFRTATVNFQTVEGTADDGIDYRGETGTLTFGPGVTSQHVDIVVLGDLTDEPNETFTLLLSTPANAQLPDTTGTATIIDDDQPGDEDGGIPLCAAGAGLPALAILMGLMLQLWYSRRFGVGA